MTELQVMNPKLSDDIVSIQQRDIVTTNMEVDEEAALIEGHHQFGVETFSDFIMVKVRALYEAMAANDLTYSRHTFIMNINNAKNQ